MWSPPCSKTLLRTRRSTKCRPATTCCTATTRTPPPFSRRRCSARPIVRPVTRTRVKSPSTRGICPPQRPQRPQSRTIQRSQCQQLSARDRMWPMERSVVDSPRRTHSHPWTASCPVSPSNGSRRPLNTEPPMARRIRLRATCKREAPLHIISPQLLAPMTSSSICKSIQRGIIQTICGQRRRQTQLRRQLILVSAGGVNNNTFNSPKFSNNITLVALHPPQPQLQQQQTPDP